MIRNERVTSNLEGEFVVFLIGLRPERSVVTLIHGRGNLMKRWLFAMCWVLLASAAHALPTLVDVEAEVQKGNYAQAQSMMHEVVLAKPGSAKAHYVYAEILAHNDDFAQASQEAALAKQIDPSLKFTHPEKFNAFEQLLDRETQRAARTPRAGSSLDSLSRAAPTLPAVPVQVQPRPAEVRSSGVPTWVWMAGLAGVALIAWRMMSRNAAASPSMAAAGNPAYGAPAGYAPPYVPNTGISPSGTGLMGVGLAAAGGVAAGMLAEKFLERGHEQRSDNSFLEPNSFANPDPLRDEDVRALEDRQIDFGSGNDWGDDGAASGGSADTGGADSW